MIKKIREGFLLVESTIEIFLISLTIMIVLAITARTMFIVTKSMKNIRDINLRQNEIVIITNIIYSEIEKIDYYNGYRAIYEFSEDSYVGLEYNRQNSLYRYYKEKGKPSGKSLISENIKSFVYEDGILKIEFEDIMK